MTHCFRCVIRVDWFCLLSLVVSGFLTHIVHLEGGLYGKIIYIFVANIYSISDYFCLVYPVIFHDTDKSLQSSILQIIGTKHIPGADMLVVVPLMFLTQLYLFFVLYAPIELQNKGHTSPWIILGERLVHQKILISVVGELDLKRE